MKKRSACFCILAFYGCSSWAMEPRQPTLSVAPSTCEITEPEQRPREINQLFVVHHFAQLPEGKARCRWQDLATVDERITQALSDCCPEDIAVLDLDDLCFETEDPTFQTRYAFQENSVYAQLHSAFDAEERQKPGYDTRYAVRMVVQKRRLIEPCIATMVHYLQEKGVPVIALSAFSAGSFCCIERLEEFKHQELFQAGIDLEKVPLSIDSEELNTQLCSDIRGRERAGAVALYRHILSSSRQEKGFVLNRLIAFMKKMPRRVYFFDDNFYNHESVLAALKRLPIPLTSFLYTGAQEQLPCSEIDETIARKQFAYMYAHSEYISYEDARELVALEQHAQDIPAPARLAVSLADVRRRDQESEEEMQELLTREQRAASLAGIVSKDRGALRKNAGRLADAVSAIPGWHFDLASIPEGAEPSDMSHDVIF